MGKVQDTLSKFARRSNKPATPPREPVALLVPAQQIPGDDSFPTTLTGVSNWLAQQDRFDTESGLSALIAGLQYSNRLKNQPTERLRILAALEAPARAALGFLCERYVALDLPLPDDASRAFDDSQTLLRELAYGYKIAIVDALSGEGKLSTQVRTEAIARALSHLSESCLRNEQCYRPYPDKIWQDVNTLFALCSEDNGTRLSVSDQAPRTVAECYLQTCILFLSDCNRLQPPQIEVLYTFVGENTGDLSIVATTKTADDQPHSTDVAARIAALGGNQKSSFAVILDSDNPPSRPHFMLTDESQPTAVFDLAYLLPHIDKLMTQSVEAASSLQNAATLSRTSLNRTHQVWTGTTGRRGARAIRSVVAYMETGLKEIHASMMRLPASVGQAASKEEFSDLESFASYSMSASVVADRLEFAPPSEFSTRWRFINQSERGYALQWTGEGPCHVHVGELIAYRIAHADGSDGWNLGIVRWLQNSGFNEINCGVEAIASHAQPVAITTALQQADAAALPCEGLLISEHSTSSGTAMLLLPEFKFKLGESIEVMGADTRQTMRLAENIGLGGSFGCFGVHEKKTETRTVASSTHN